MRNEDVKVGMRVVYHCTRSPYQLDRGVVVRNCDENDDGWWIQWDSNDEELWLNSSDFEPENVLQPEKEQSSPSKQARIGMMATLFTAVQQGKQIECCVDGNWYAAYIEDVCFANAHQFRVKPEYVKTIGYRRYVKKEVNGYFVSVMRENVKVPLGESFVKWIDTEWQYETVELS